MAGNPLTRSLINDDNSCYANSLLQMLARIPDMKKWTREYRHVGNEEPRDCIKCILRETLLDMWKPPWTISFIPWKLLNWIRGKDKRFAKGTQGDPHELLAFLMDEIQLDIFQHGELEKVACNIAEHRSQEAVEVIPPGPGIQCYIGTSRNEDLTDRDLLRSYNFSITADGCSLCTGRKCLERIIASPPSVLLLKINRFTKERNGWFKNDSSCVISPELELSLNDNDSVKYKMTGVIEHQGDTPTTGHYVSTVIDNRQWFTYSDNLVMRREISKEETYMTFYSKMDNIEETQPPLEQDETDVFDEKDVISVQNEMFGENPEIDEWREIYSKRIHSEWHTKCRLLVFCLPKTCEADSFKEQYEKCVSTNQRMLYTVTWSNSNFLWRLRTDPVIQSDFDVYHERIAPIFGTNDVYAWLAEAFVIYILHNHINRENSSMEYICDLNSQSIVTQAIVRNWKNIKPNVIKSLRNLLQGKSLFCLDSCTRSCNAEKDHYHQSLATMIKMVPPEDIMELSSLNNLALNVAAEQIIDHPLEKLLKPAVLNKDEDLETQLVRFLEEIKINERDSHSVYMLLVVNSSVPHKPEDLFTMWSANTADFGIYVGMTKQGKFRQDHLFSESQGGTTSVSAFLKNTSVVYLVTSKEYNSYNKAALAESKLIAVFRHQQEESRKTGIKLKYSVLNKNLPVVPLFEADKKDRLEYDNFIKLGCLPFRFLHEPFEDIVHDESILQRYLVEEVVKVPGRSASMDTTFEKERLKCNWCEKNFDNEKALDDHVKLHEERSKYICKICRKTFRLKYSLVRHKRERKCKVSYACEICSARFKDTKSLFHHKHLDHAEKNFVCEICNEGFITCSALISHKKTHEPQKKYVCEICIKKFSDSSALQHHKTLCRKVFVSNEPPQSHRRKPSSNKNYVCSVCEKGFCSSDGLTQHMRCHNEDRKYVCEECKKSFAREDSLKQHYFVHKTEKDFICNICQQGFVNNSGLTKHIRSHNGDKKFKCSICGKSFLRSDTLKKHVATHSDEKEHKCPLCEKCFSRKDSLNEHIKTHSNIKIHKCPSCERCFSRKHSLNEHIKTHSKTKKHKCPLCEKCFSRKQYVNEHMKLHNTDTKYICSVCGKQFNNYDGFRLHMRCHNEEYTYVCQECKKPFNRPDSLRQHYDVHKTGKTFVCNICQKGFVNNNRLQKHIISHNTEKKCKCSICNKGFSRSDALTRHVRNVHNI